MKRFLAYCAIFSTFIILAACDQRRVAEDGYWFSEPTMLNTSFTVNVVLLKGQQEMDLTYEALTGERAVDRRDRPPLAAFGSLAADGTHCTLYLIDARERYEPVSYGHELTHCIYGEWHRDQEAPR